MQAGETLHGCFMPMPAPAVGQMGDYAGFDFRIRQPGQGPSGTELLEHLRRAADAAGMPAFVRTSGAAPGEILRALDAGATGIVVPHVRTPADARAIALAAHYPPQGSRG